jgi:hypothetical protein
MNATQRRRLSNLLSVIWVLCLIWIVAVLQVVGQIFDAFHEFDRFLAGSRSLWVFWVPTTLGVLALVGWIVVRQPDESDADG